MADNNLSAPEAEPDVTTPQTYDDQVEDLSNLLDDPATDPIEDDQDEAAAEPEAEEEEDPLFAEDDAEDVETEDADDPDGSEPEVKGGRFAPHTAKVTLDNGDVITVAELVRNNMFQRDYTKKREADIAEKKQWEAEREEVDQYAQSLNQSREYLAWYAEQFLPQEPKPFTGDAVRDPVAYMQWQQQRDAWATHQQAFQTFQQQKAEEEQRKSGETQKQAQSRLLREREALFEAIPVLKDPKKGPQAWNTLVSGAAEFGFSEAEVNALADHRYALVLRAAIKLKRIEAGAKSVQAKVAQKPITPGKRAAPNAQESQGRKVRSERLRTSGSFEDGVVALQDFDL
ncbi:MAG TPA: hypothetical protein VF982_00225 [Anaerolineales bacterium]